MNSAAEILNGVEAANAAVKCASLEWQPSDLSRVQASARAIEACLPGLRTSYELVSRDERLPNPHLRKAARDLCSETAALQLLVDAAAAFIRNSPDAATPHTYSRDGVSRLDNTLRADSYTG